MLCYRISHRAFVSVLTNCSRCCFTVFTGVESYNSHVLSVALCDLVSDGILVGQVFIVEEVLPALRLIEISNLSWCTERRKEAEMYLQIRIRDKLLIHLIFTILISANADVIHNANKYVSTSSTTVKNRYCSPNNTVVRMFSTIVLIESRALFFIWSNARLMWSSFKSPTIATSAGISKTGSFWHMIYGLPD